MGRADPSGENHIFVNGSAAQQKDFDDALNNLAGTPQGDKIIAEIRDNPRKTYKVRFKNDGSGSEADYPFSEIDIDLQDLTCQQYRTKDGKWEYYSWEHIIAHEGGHLVGPEPDEQKTVDEWENPATAKTGLPKRGRYKDHHTSKTRPLPSPVKLPQKGS